MKPASWLKRRWQRLTCPKIYTTPAELCTERFWVEQVDPLALTFGIECPTTLLKDPHDRHAHQLIDRGRLLFVVRTDGKPLCCPYHDRFPDVSLSCAEARTNRSAIGWRKVYGNDA